MAENWSTTTGTGAQAKYPPGQRADFRKAGVSVAGLVFALAFACIASVGITGDPWWLLNQGTKWVAVGLLAVVGIGLVLTTLPGRGKR
ncbi:hypothetical protein EH165_11345 [Nakamurella antarctica]|uniref:Uncharacterized protein n=1 Tax=Nakamurella antarctica TaxID=1902245 RepID=A0A3G8ZMU1_9ACTN|nr:hypothetical protein [Nakamurella antarctica]AZI58639.1 hypothetical protein EH165_11345 [Nakamurella antarctica]